MFQANSDKLFKSEGDRNLMFSDSTKCLQEITKTPVEFLTQTYIDMIEKTYKTVQGPPGKQCVYHFIYYRIHSCSKQMDVVINVVLQTCRVTFNLQNSVRITV